MPATLEVEIMHAVEPAADASGAFRDAALERAPAITWFEIPALDYEATAAFYEALLDTSLQRHDDQMGRYAMFAAPKDAAAGCVAPAEGRKPGSDGVLVFLWCGLELDPVLARAKQLGARIAAPKRILPHGIGAVAQIIDPEGNRVGLHAQR